ncbi:MAG: FAD-dependent oxidoreductase, partial [Campylobacterales bacterium]|nr:FAD-dependent oxidoreductase [Campylobacterales bacterium]
MYDGVVVGGGIAGCAIAYWLNKKGLKVCIVDKASEVASGGSGAAGAFVAPKIGKASPLQALTNEAFLFATQFYTHHFPRHFHQTGAIRIPKDDRDHAKFPLYRQNNVPNFVDITSHEIQALGIHSPYDGFFFEEGGVVDAKEMCHALIEGIEFKTMDINTIEQNLEGWRLNQTLQSRYLILATGYQNGLMDMDYMGVEGVW